MQIHIFQELILNLIYIHHHLTSLKFYHHQIHLDQKFYNKHFQ